MFLIIQIKTIVHYNWKYFKNGLFFHLEISCEFHQENKDWIGFLFRKPTYISHSTNIPTVGSFLFVHAVFFWKNPRTISRTDNSHLRPICWNRKTTFKNSCLFLPPIFVLKNYYYSISCWHFFSNYPRHNDSFIGFKSFR